MQALLRVAAMRAGATLTAPDTVFLSYDTKLGRDVTVGPHVVFAPGVTVEDGVTPGVVDRARGQCRVLCR